MPGAKRGTKSVSYTEQNDDDDFVSKSDKINKTRSSKTDDQPTESKSSTRQAPRKRKEKLSKAEQDELDLALQLSKASEVSIEISSHSDDKESTTSQSTESSHESKSTTDKETDEQDENVLPKSKRMKREEEEVVDESESGSDEEEEEEEEANIDEEEPTTPEKKPVRTSKETKKHSEVPTVTSIDLNAPRSTTRAQQKSSTSTSDAAQQKSNAPVGFPTSKIVIPSVQTSRVGLSRNSSAIKPLHRNLNQRIVHE